MRVTQIDTSPEGGGGHRDTDTEMCDDLAWCLDTLGQSSSLHCALPGLSNTAAQQEKQEMGEIRTRLVDHLTSHFLSFVTHESRPGSTLSVSL